MLVEATVNINPSSSGVKIENKIGTCRGKIIKKVPEGYLVEVNPSIENCKTCIFNQNCNKAEQVGED